MAAKANPIEQFARLSLAHKALVALLLLAAGAVAFYFVFYQDIEAQIAKEKKEKASLEASLSQYRTQLQDKRTFQEEIIELKKKRERALEKLPAGDEIPSLLQKIHGQAMIVGLDIITFRRDDEVTQGFYSAIPVFMELRGTFHQIVTFFYYVGKLTRIVNLSNVELEIQEEKPEKVILNAKVQAVTFKYSGGSGGGGEGGGADGGAAHGGVKEKARE